MAIRGIWWKDDNGSYIHVSISVTNSKEISIFSNRSTKVLRSVLIPSDEVVVSLTIKDIDTIPHYLTVVTDNGEDIMIQRLYSHISYEEKEKLGFKLRDYAADIQSVYISVTKAILNQLDGLLANI